jgi:hypothetical protein
VDVLPRGSQGLCGLHACLSLQVRLRDWFYCIITTAHHVTHCITVWQMQATGQQPSHVLVICLVRLTLCLDSAELGVSAVVFPNQLHCV